MRKKVLAVTSLLCMTFSTILTSSVQAQSRSQFVYAYVLCAPNDCNNETVYGINPLDPSHPQALFSRFTLSNADVPYPSPDGKWYALGYGYNLGFTSDSDTMLYVVNARDGQTHQVGQLDAYDGDSRLTDRFPEVFWSPDGQRLVYPKNDLPSPNANPKPGDKTNVFVYSVADGKRTRAFVQGFASYTDHFEMAWSHDSKRLVTEAFHGTGPATCEITLDIYETASWNLNNSIVLEREQTPCEPDPVCYLQWSPDDQLIAFVSGCDVSEGSFELFVADPDQGVVRQISNMTLEAQKTSGVTVPAFVNGLVYPAWINTNTLVAGFSMNWISSINSKITSPDIHITKTVAYIFHDRQVNTQVISNRTILWWAVNSKTSEVAFRDGENSGCCKALNIQIATFQHGVFTVTHDLPQSCDYAAWAPDGSALACNSYAKDSNHGQLIMYQDATGHLQQIDFPVGAGSIGWLAAPNL